MGQNRLKTYFELWESPRDLYIRTLNRRAGLFKSGLVWFGMVWQKYLYVNVSSSLVGSQFTTVIVIYKQKGVNGFPQKSHVPYLSKLHLLWL